MNHSDKKPDRQSGRPAKLEGGMPEQIGPYRVLEVLGEGGMGMVYLAQQEQPLRRRVALKIIKLGMDTREVIARFESERQALALMNHPHIAKVFDAGSTEQGRPYFAMEYAAGIPLTKYCDQHRLGIRARLGLFIQVCQAIHHAHQKGIIHRDIKPSNVLVAEEEGQAAPKVIDFGIAKATHQRLTEKTLQTQQGAFMGTPEYMSPEQAESAGVDVDTTTDVYSLGVLLYELLVGVPPFNLLLVGYQEMVRRIREKPAPTLATRLSGLGEEKAGKMAERRHTEVRGLRRQLRGELNWIVQKALEKDRTRRYQAASELAADVVRYLKQDAVSASPPSRTYQLRKFVARHKGPVAVAVALVLLLLGFGVRERIQGQRIAREAATAEQVSTFMVDMFKVSDPSEARGNTITAREILDQGAEKIEQELKQQPEVQARLMATMGTVYRGLGLYEQAAPLLEQALKLRERELGPEHPDVGESLNTLGALYWNQGKFAEAELVLRRAIIIREKALGPDHPDVATSLNILAVLYLHQGKLAEAEPLLQRALTVREKALGPEHPLLADSLNNLPILYLDQGKYAQAEPLYLRVLAIDEKILGPDHHNVARSLNNLAILYKRQGKYAQAEPLYLHALAILEKVLGPNHRDVASPLTNLADLYTEQGKYGEAEPLHRRAMNIYEDKLGPEHPDLASSLHGLANAYRGQDRLGEAEPLYERALAIREKGLGTDHPDVASTLNDMAKLYEKQGKTSRAESAFQRALAIREKALSPDHPDLLTTLEDHAALLRKLGRGGEADKLVARAQTLKSKPGR